MVKALIVVCRGTCTMIAPFKSVRCLPCLFTRNTGLSRFVRFNIQQALLLDILLVIPGVLGSATRMFPYDLQVIGTNFWFYLMVLVVGYSWAQVAQGKNPDQVPFISEAANLQIGPF